MEPQRPGSGQGAYNGYDGWGRPQGAPQQPGPGVPPGPGASPGPEATYEVPWDFENGANASGGAANAGSAAPGGAAAGAGQGWGAPAGQRSGSQGRTGPSQARPNSSQSQPNSSQGWTSADGSGSPIPGMSAKDFQKMCRSVDKAFSQFARVVGKGVDSAASAMGTSVQENLDAYRQMYAGRDQAALTRAQQRQDRALMKQRFRPTGDLTASGVIMTALGAAGTLAFGITALLGTGVGLLAGPGPVVAAGVFGLLAVAAAGVTTAGIGRLRLASRIRRIRNLFGTREVVTFDELSQRGFMPRKTVMATSQKMLKRGLLPQGRIDDEGTCLMVTDNAWQQYRTLKAYSRQIDERQAQEAGKGSAPAPASAAAQPEGAPTAGETDAAAAAGIPLDGLPPEAKALVKAGNGYLAQLRQLDVDIDDEAVSQKIVAIEAVVRRILERAAAEPKVTGGLTRLSDYYLPTTVKLLDAYARLEDQPVQGENIASSRREIEHTLDVLISAYEKLLDDTFQELNMDVSADISVLHAVLAQEGLVDGPFDMKP